MAMGEYIAFDQVEWVRVEGVVPGSTERVGVVLGRTSGGGRLWMSPSAGGSARRAVALSAVGRVRRESGARGLADDRRVPSQNLALALVPSAQSLSRLLFLADQGVWGRNAPTPPPDALTPTTEDAHVRLWRLPRA